jgi:hypothetical protein
VWRQSEDGKSQRGTAAAQAGWHSSWTQQDACYLDTLLQREGLPADMGDLT